MYTKARTLEREDGVVAKQDRTGRILEKLRQRAEQIGYGCLVCEVQIHDGQIRQVDVTTAKERMRGD